MITDPVNLIPENHGLRAYQKQNLSCLLEISRSFGHDADIGCCNNSSLHEDTIVLESGHQPNFFPYSGVWKKVYLLAQFQEKMAEKGIEGIAFFGFADQNFTTAPFLYKNQIPALNKSGMQKIGFSVKGAEKWKCINKIGKPLPEIWEKEMGKLENLYSGIQSKNQEIPEIMWKSYERADSFSDLNAFIFSRISRDILGFDVHFFRYSDIQCNQLFFDECKQILENLDHYNTVYNTIIRKANLPLRPVVSGELPFWYHCDCGSKTSLLIDSFGVCRGTCPFCNKEYELDFNTDFSQLNEYYGNMSFCAVSRNLVFAEGLGTHLFVSGSGGGLRYGKVSNAISSAIGFNQPLTCSWSSKDYYLGNIHRKAVKELQNMFSLTKADLLDSALNDRMCEFRENLAEKVAEMEAEGADKKSLRLNKGRFLGSAKTADMVSMIFSSVPSMFDICMNLDKEDIVKSWHEALYHSVPGRDDSSYIFEQDVVYEGGEMSEFSFNEIPVLYRNMCAVGGVG